MRRLAALSLLVPALLVPLGGSARAAGPPTTGDTVLVVQDGSFYRGSADLTDYGYAGQNLVGTDGTDGSGFRAAADGSRFVYALDRAGPHPGDLTSRIVVRDAGGRLVRYVDGVHGTFTDDQSLGSIVDTPSLTPDGNQVAYTVRNRFGTELRRAVIASPGAGVQRVPNSVGLESPVALSDNLSMLALRAGTLYGVTPLGTRRVVSGLPAGSVISYAVSPDRTKIVYQHAVPDGSALSVAALVPGTYPAYSAGPSTTLVPQVLGTDPGFSHDGSTVYWAEGGDIWSVPAAGGPATDLTNDGSTPSQTNVVGVTLDEGAAPGPVTGVTATLGASPVVRWSLPADADLSGVSLVRTAAGQPPLVRYLPAPLTSYTDPFLPDESPATTYTYTLTAVDRSGHPSATKASVQLQPRIARLQAVNPTSRVASTPPFAVHLPPGRYNLSVRTNGVGDFVRIATDASGDFVFGRDLGTTASVGGSYTFRLQVFDELGNATLPTLQSPVVVPFDDGSFTYTGSTDVITSSRAFLGKEHVLHDGATAAYSSPGRVVWVMGSTCRTCGVLDVYVGGIRFARIDTRDGTVPVGYHRDREVLVAFPNYYASQRITLRVHGGNAILDGLAFRR